MEEIINFEYPINRNRHNTKQEGEIHHGMALGLVNLRPCNVVKNNNKPQQMCRLHKMRKYDNIWKTTTKWFEETYPLPFEYTTIQYNKNNKCKKHIDAKNVGESIIIALGDFEGGRLIIYDYEGEEKKYVDIKNNFFRFNGSKYFHETEDFTGNRISLVFFNIN